MNEANSRIMMVFSMITRGKAKKFMKNLEENGIGFHFQTNAVGTAPSEMMDIFGLGSNDKDIVSALHPRALLTITLTRSQEILVVALNTEVL